MTHVLGKECVIHVKLKIIGELIVQHIVKIVQSIYVKITECVRIKKIIVLLKIILEKIVTSHVLQLILIVYIVIDKKNALNVKIEQNLEINVIFLVRTVLETQDIAIIQVYVIFKMNYVIIVLILEQIVQYYALINMIIVKNVIEIIYAWNAMIKPNTEILVTVHAKIALEIQVIVIFQVYVKIK